MSVPPVEVAESVSADESVDAKPVETSSDAGLVIRPRGVTGWKDASERPHHEAERAGA